MLKLLRHCFLQKETKLSCDHSHVKICADRKLHKRKIDGEYWIFFNFVYLVVSFLSSHPVLNYEIKYIEIL